MPRTTPKVQGYKPQIRSIRIRQKAKTLFLRAYKAEERGRFLSAFRLYLAAAKLGDSGAQLNLGNYYDDGNGVRRNRSAALYWYKRAYRRGDSSGAHNIGVVLRKENKLKQALAWFRRAVKLTGGDESNIDIGKHYLFNENDPRQAIRYFERVIPSEWVSEADVEEATKLLKQAKRKLKKRPAATRHS